MTTLCSTSIISRNHDIAYTQIDTDFVLLEPNTNIFCNVNPTGAALWALLENNALTLDALCKYICNNYRVSEEECLKDVTQFVEEMLDQNLFIIANCEK